MQREQAPATGIQWHLNTTDSIGDQNGLWWEGQFTDGECGCRGTRLYLRENAALACCSDCGHLTPCDYATNDATNCADTWSMRAESVRHLIDEIRLFKTAEDWATRGAFGVSTPCPLCGHQRFGFTDWSPHWLNKDAVLAELELVAMHCRENNVFQDWV